ncbi:MAG: fibronectin type III domain-containing protein [Bacteroidales bacterium]|nr:fibronectin type III domain-containing protein [Bacteroidales bacterium]
MKSYRKFQNIIWTIGFLIFMSYGCFKDIKIPEVTTGTVSDITSTSAIISDNTNGDGGGYVSSRGICWSNMLAEPSIKEDNIYYEGHGSGTFSVYIANLTPGTTYYARAFATNTEGTGYGPVVTFTTQGSMT